MQRNNYAERNAELKYLLDLVASQDWTRIPARMDPVWLEPGGQDHYCTNKPARIVMSLLENVICELDRQLVSSLSLETQLVLWEIQAVCMVTGEYAEAWFFEVPLGKMSQAEALWRAIGRLCGLALQEPKLREIEQSLTFQYFVEAYSSPATEADLKFGVR